MFINTNGTKCSMKTTKPTFRLYKRGVRTTPSKPHIVAASIIAVAPIYLFLDSSIFPYPIVKIIIPPIVITVPMILFTVTASPPKIIPIKAPKSGEVNAIGITLLSGAPFIAR